MPTVTSSSVLAAGRVTDAAATTTVGSFLGRATEATIRILAANATDSYSVHPPTGSPYFTTTMAAGGHFALGPGMAALTTTTTSTTTAPPEPQALVAAARASGPEIAVSPVPTPSLYAFDELGHWSTTSNDAALIHALLASFSVILVSELGDKTFIITAIMAMKNSRSLVFVASALALLLMTVLSVGMGVAVTVIPEVYTHYASIVLFLCFGLKMLKESYDMAHAAGDNGESEFEEVKRSLEGEGDEHSMEDLKGAHQTPGAKQASESAGGRPGEGAAPKAGLWWKLRDTLYVAPIVIKVFTMVFVAEWGDRSQISTVILAAREDVVGVFVGSLSGHVFCTGLAVIGGRFVADMISVRTMTLLGGIIFLFFATFELMMGPDGQQV